MARLSCAACRIVLGEGETHCPRCRLRIAALPARAAGVPGRSASPRGGWRAITVRGVLGGLVIIGFAAALAAILSPGRGSFGLVFDNIAGIGGLIALALAVFLGGVRVRRWGSDPAAMRGRFGGAASLASTHDRLAIAVAGSLPLAVAIALAVTIAR